MLLTAILLCLYCSLVMDSSLIYPIKKLAIMLNNYCSSYFTDGLLSTPINQSLVCGSKLSNTNSIKYYFSQLGVIHLLIASGAHLYFLKIIANIGLKFIPIKKQAKYILINTLLFLYVAISAFNPPLLRAFIGLSILQKSQFSKLHWKSLTALLTSIACSLLLDTKLWNSYSLILSWVVCSALSLNLRPLKKCTLIYFISLPILLQFQWVHPISIITNLLFAPVFSVIHFPLSFLSLTSETASLLSNNIWILTLEVFKRIQQNISFSAFKIKAPIYWLWLYALTLHVLVSLYSRNQKRKFYFS